MMLKKIKLFSLLLVILLLVPSNIYVFGDKLNDDNIKIVQIDTELSEYVDDYETLQFIIEENYGLELGELCGIISLTENVDDGISTLNQVPAGYLVLTGQYTSAHHWKLTILNISKVTVNSITSVVEGYNNIAGQVLKTPRSHGFLGPSIAEQSVYAVPYHTLDYMYGLVKATTSAGQYVELEIKHYR